MNQILKQIQEEFRKKFEIAREQNDHWNQWEDEVSDFLTQSNLRVLEKVRQVAEEAIEQERQFILNILDGIDIADEQMGNKGGGTKAIRLALQTRAKPDLSTLIEQK